MSEETPMRLQFDEEVDAFYLCMDESPSAEPQGMQPVVLLDFNERDQVMRIELCA